MSSPPPTTNATTTNVMTADQFNAEKRRILDNAENWKCFQDMKKKIDIKSKRPGHAQQCPFSFAGPAPLQEWGWPFTPEREEMCLKIVQEYLLKFLGWKFRVRDVVEANLLKDHHGIGPRYEELNEGKQWSGVLVKTYDAVYHKNDKDAKKQFKESQKSPPTSPRKKDDAPPPKKSKSKGLFGSKKKK